MDISDYVYSKKLRRGKHILKVLCLTFTEDGGGGQCGGLRLDDHMQIYDQGKVYQTYQQIKSGM